LQLPHATASRGNPSVIAAGDTGVRQAPDGVIEEVERLHAELQRVAFFWHAEVFMRREVPGEAAGPNHRVPSGIAEVVDRLQSERRGIEPPRRGRIVQRLALAGGIRTV